MVKRCNYASPEVEERLVRDRFVVGLLDRNLSDKLCRSPKLTLQEALTHVRQHEDAENERRARDSADSLPLAVDAAARVRSTKGKTRSPDRPNQRGCFFCGLLRTIVQTVRLDKQLAISAARKGISNRSA